MSTIMIFVCAAIYMFVAFVFYAIFVVASGNKEGQ